MGSLKLYKSNLFVDYMGREVNLKQVFFVLVLVLAMQFVFSATDTELEIANLPPELIKDIPNQSWQSDTVLEDAFDLDDYFEDIEGDTITYTFSNMTNITINIDEDNNVSFFPDLGFIGTETVTFYAHDLVDYGESNLVYLDVGLDTEPPKWSDAKKDKAKVYQNDFVTFNVTWTDNFELSNYTFYINQEGVWTEKKGEMNGTKDYSTPRVQISSPAGKIVQWKVCASDTSYNTACTDVFEFDVLVVPTNPPSSGEDTENDSTDSTDPDTDGTILYDAIKEIFTKNNEPDFSFNVNAFLVNLKQGTGTTKVLEITNTGTETLNFTLYIEELEEYVELSEEVFNLSAGSTKRITVDFKVGLETEQGEYHGVLVVESFKEAKIPLFISVNEIDLEYGIIVSVLENSKIVKPGKEVVAKIDLKNLKDQFPVDAVLYYAVKDFNGEIYNFNEENITFDSTLSLERALEISEESPIGNYVFYARVYNLKDSAIYSDEFQVGYKFQFAAFVKTSSIFVLIFFLSFVMFFFVVRYKRQRERGRVLNLYVKLNELKELVKKGKFEQAAKEYVGIKRIYGEHVSPDLLENQQKLTEAIKELASKIDFSEPVKKEEDSKNEGEKKEVGNSKVESGKTKKEGEGEEKEGEKEEKNEGEKKEVGNSKSIEKTVPKKVVVPNRNVDAKKKVVKKPVEKTEVNKIEKKVPATKKKIIPKKEGENVVSKKVPVKTVEKKSPENTEKITKEVKKEGAGEKKTESNLKKENPGEGENEK